MNKNLLPKQMPAFAAAPVPLLIFAIVRKYPGLTELAYTDIIKGLDTSLATSYQDSEFFGINPISSDATFGDWFSELRRLQFLVQDERLSLRVSSLIGGPKK